RVMAMDVDEQTGGAEARGGEETTVVGRRAGAHSIPTRRLQGPGAVSTVPAEDSGGEGQPSPYRAALRIDRYELVAEPGAGGMGGVWSAPDVDRGREVALKLIRSASWPLPRQRARLMREARAMARLSHPNVVTVHDVGTTDEGLFIAMECIRGGTLRE